MCGICGLFSASPLNPELRQAVRRMQTGLTHRGPDGGGEYAAERLHMAMRRLSIIDLEGASQPLYNEDRSLALIVNGEIYNYLELREDLKQRGHVFRTGGDCETILHLYEERGSDCVHALRGMFAFALWDAPARKLLLARDRMGEKPLYIARRPEGLIFASELKAVLASGLTPFELNPWAVNAFFHYNFVPEPASPVQGVDKLPAGHTLLLSLEDDGRIGEKLTRYWRLDGTPPMDLPPDADLETTGGIVRDMLRETMRLLVRSDVPVGVALSGGVDSSTIAALASEFCGDALQAVGVGYRGCPDCDERALARDFAKKLGIPFHEAEIAPEEMIRFFPEMVWWTDELIADVAGYGYFSVMRKAREMNIPVMLQGHGGDELFWGYGWVKECPDRALAAMPELLERLGPGASAPMPFIDVTTVFRTARADMPEFWGRDFAGALRDAPPVETPFSLPLPWDRTDIDITRIISEVYMLANGINQGDRLGMASGVELRLPLVDYRVVETVIGLRKSVPDHRLPPKARLKAAMRGILPEELLNRPKLGFAPPVADWMQALRQAYGQTLVHGHLTDSGVLDPNRAERLTHDEFLQWRGSPLFFKALVLEHWCRAMLRTTRNARAETDSAGRTETCLD